MKRLEDGLFTNVVDESTAVIQTSKIRATRTAFRKHIEEKQTEGSDTNNSEESNSRPEDNTENEDIFATYSNIQNNKPIQDIFEQSSKVHIEMKKLRAYLSDPTINPNYQGKYGSTALFRAVKTEDKTIVKTLLAYPRVDVNLADHNGYTPLMEAADQGSVPIVKLLLGRKDIKVNLRDQNGYTALMWAIEHQRVVEA